ncbi:MAG: flippase-like domain-containing protein [Bdellovibrionales bacterium]|nr:flippase-like domain-containing protein [Bdellovibrionales bacterium]
MHSTPTKRTESGNLTGILAGVAISAAILVFLALQIEWSVFLAQFGRLQITYIPLLIALFYITFWIRGVRWRYLLPSNLEVSTKELYDVTLVGFFASCVLPLRAGELVRPWVLSLRQPVRFPVGLSSVVTERVFDVLTILALLALALPDAGEAHQLVTVGAKALAVLAAGILAVMLAAYFCAERLLGFARKVLSIVLRGKHDQLQEKLLYIADDVVAGLRAVSSVRELLLVLFWSLALWLTIAALYQVGLWTFGEFPPFSVGVSVTVLIALAVAAPSAPGFLGTFQVGCTAALSWMFGYPEEFALAYSVVLHAYQLLLMLLSGALILRRFGFSLRSLRARSAEAEAQA